MSDIAGMPVLALILFAPWFLILSVMYWVYPRQPRDARRRLFDAVALLVAFVAFWLFVTERDEDRFADKEEE